jgi:hypothetical protein
MDISSGSLVELIDITTGIYIVENNETITTKRIYVEEGIYLVLESLGYETNCYIEILYDNNVVLISYKHKFCIIL